MVSKSAVGVIAGNKHPRMGRSVQSKTTNRGKINTGALKAPVSSFWKFIILLPLL